MGDPPPRTNSACATVSSQAPVRATNGQKRRRKMAEPTWSPRERGEIYFLGCSFCSELSVLSCAFALHRPCMRSIDLDFPGELTVLTGLTGPVGRRGRKEGNKDKRRHCQPPPNLQHTHGLLPHRGTLTLTERDLGERIGFSTLQLDPQWHSVAPSLPQTRQKSWQKSPPLNQTTLSTAQARGERGKERL